MTANCCMHVVTVLHLCFNGLDWQQFFVKKRFALLFFSCSNYGDGTDKTDSGDDR